MKFLTTITVENFFLTTNINLPSFSLKPLHLVHGQSIIVMTCYGQFITFPLCCSFSHESSPCSAIPAGTIPLLRYGALHRLHRNFTDCKWSTSFFSYFSDLGVPRAVSHIFSPSLHFAVQRPELVSWMGQSRPLIIEATPAAPH